MNVNLILTVFHVKSTFLNLRVARNQHFAVLKVKWTCKLQSRVNVKSTSKLRSRVNVKSTSLSLMHCTDEIKILPFSKWINIFAVAHMANTRFCMGKRSKLSRKKYRALFNTPKQYRTRILKSFGQSSLLTKLKYVMLFFHRAFQFISLTGKNGVLAIRQILEHPLIRGSARTLFYIHLVNWLLARKPTEVKWQNIRIRSYIILWSG